ATRAGLSAADAETVRCVVHPRALELCGRRVAASSGDLRRAVASLRAALLAALARAGGGVADVERATEQSLAVERWQARTSSAADEPAVGQRASARPAIQPAPRSTKRPREEGPGGDRGTPAKLRCRLFRARDSEPGADVDAVEEGARASEDVDAVEEGARAGEETDGTEAHGPPSTPRRGQADVSASTPTRLAGRPAARLACGVAGSARGPQDSPAALSPPTTPCAPAAPAASLVSLTDMARAMRSAAATSSVVQEVAALPAQAQALLVSALRATAKQAGSARSVPLDALRTAFSLLARQQLLARVAADDFLPLLERLQGSGLVSVSGSAGRAARSRSGTPGRRHVRVTTSREDVMAALKGSTLLACL
ncbi:unnamed protein product, partial [Symbiodinium sp. KB8]